MNTRYFDLTKEQKLTLTQDQLQVAIELEAVHRGIKPPISLSNELNQHPFIGYTTPADAVAFYEVTCPPQYGSANEPTGLCFRTEKEAVNAAQGAICIANDGYSHSPNKIRSGDFGVRVIHISLTKTKTFAAKLEEYAQDDTEFDKLAQECAEDIHKLHQEDYDRQVNAQKRAKYLSLAQGNEEIAKAFWNSAERTEWPSA